MTMTRIRPVNAYGQPRTVPLVHVMEGGDGYHRLAYADEQSPCRRKKPDGIACLELEIVVSATRAADSPPTKRTERITRSPFTVHHDRADAGSHATYRGRWISKKGLAGLWSLPIGMTIVTVAGPGPPKPEDERA